MPKSLDLVWAMASLALGSDAAADVADFMDACESSEGSREEEQHGNEDGAASKRGKKAKSKAKAKAVKKDHVKKKGPKGPEDGWRKCKQCTAWKEAESFNESQSKCKDCFNNNRSLRRIAEKQGLKEDLISMERDDPKQHAALVKAFNKERDSCKKTGEKIKFSINSFKLSYRAHAGVRGEQEGEMMWEAEWIEESKKAKHGFLSREEAESLWQGWLKDPKHPRDQLGPRNYVRLWVKTRDKISYFDEVSKDKELVKEERLGKAPSRAAIDSRLKLMAGDQGLESHELSDFSALTEKAVASMAASQGAGESAMSGEGILGPDVEALLEGVNAKMKRRTAALFVSVAVLQPQVLPASEGVLGLECYQQMSVF